MPSFITNDFENVFLELFRKNIEADSDRYYVGISAADSSESGLFGQNQVRNELLFLKVNGGKSFVVANNTWSSGRQYNAYDDNLPAQESFYVINSLNEVFLCIEQSKTAAGVVQNSTVEPTASLAAAYKSIQNSFRTSDGYVWRYLYKLTADSINNFKTNDYIPVSKILEIASPIPEKQEQRNLQNNAIAGEVLGIAIDSGGTGYTFAPIITVRGDEDSAASFTAAIEDGRIVRVIVDSDNNGRLLHGNGYNYADVEVSTGTASLRAILGPKEGINADPVKSLKSSEFMIITEIQDDEDGTIPLAPGGQTNDFKQIALIRNPKVFGTTDSDFTANAGNAMNYFTLTGASGTFTADEIVAVGDTQAKVYWHDTSNQYLYYIQNHETGFREFLVSQTIQGQTSSVTAQIATKENPDIDRYSGDVLYINNLDDAIDRTSTQTEDIKIVIDLG